MLDINKRSMLDRSSAEIERSQTKPAIIEELLSVVCRLPLEQALADDLILAANLDLVHKDDAQFTLVALQHDDFVVRLVLDDGAVALKVLAHVLQDLLKVELLVKPFDQSRGLAPSSLLHTNSDPIGVPIVGLT